jgi:hypothetical protein
MFALIASLVADIPIFDKWFNAILTEYQSYQAAKAKAAAAAVVANTDAAFEPLIDKGANATDADRQAAAKALDASLSSE